MGNYEQFLGRDIGPEDYMTSGMVYSSVIERERNLGYGGKCGPIQQLYLRNQRKLDVDGDGNMRAILARHSVGLAAYEPGGALVHRELVTASHFSPRIHRSEAPSPSPRGSRNGNESPPRCGHLQP